MNVSPPGTQTAIDLGCTCPVLENNYGRGAHVDADGVVVFWHSEDCPLHVIGGQYDGVRVEPAQPERRDVPYYGLDGEWDLQP